MVIGNPGKDIRRGCSYNSIGTDPLMMVTRDPGETTSDEDALLTSSVEHSPSPSICVTGFVFTQHCFNREDRLRPPTNQIKGRRHTYA